MRIENNRLKLLSIVLILFLCTSLIIINTTLAIYRSRLSTVINLTVVDPESNLIVTFDENYTGGTTWNVTKEYEEELGSDYTVPSRTGYNFLGWFTDDTDGTEIGVGTVITSNVIYYAHWEKIVCMKAKSGTLHTETCSSGGGCLEHGYSTGDTITYGNIPGNGNPAVGDAYDCDVNNDGVYNPTTERFYFVRKTTGDEDKAILVHYTSFDENGQMDSSASRGNYSYDLGKTYLPSLTFPQGNAWSNPNLTNFGGKTSRYINHDDLISACGGTVIYDDASYLSTCQFFLENSRYQSGMLGRLGIWVDKENDTLYRINTQAAEIENPDNNANTVRPVIEVSTGKLEKYQAGTIYIIHFDTHGGTPVSSIHKYNGETLGNIVTTKEHFDFVGWYANYNNEEYTNLITPSTVIRGNMTLHAKWTPKEIHTVTFNANGGTINGESTYELEVENGSTVNDEDFPEAIYGERTLVGWYINGEQLYPFTSATVVRDDIEVFANWESDSFVAQIGVTKYETLAAAVTDVPTNSTKTTITILKDIELSATVTILANKWVELDIGEYTISNSSNFTMSGQENANSALLNVNNKGKLDIINGTIYSTNPYIIYNASGGTVNISGGLFEYNNASATEFKSIQNTGGTVNISGGTLTCNSQAATINNKNSTGVLNVSGGAIIATGTTKGQAIYMDSGAKTTISGDVYIENTSNSTNNNARAAVDNTDGTLTITGGTIVSKQYNAVASRSGNVTTTIGIDDGDVSNTAPVIRGKKCGLSVEAGITSVYDGIFESPTQANTICTKSGITITVPTTFVDGTEHPIIEGTTYYTKYLKQPEYTVTFYYENGEDPYEITVSKGDVLGNDIPEDPTKSGYYFGGWYDGDTLVTSDTIISGVTDIYARWVRSLDNGTIITNPSPFNVEIDGTGQISFEEDDIEPVSYSSSDNTVATVDEFGIVTGHTIDSATITLTGQKSGLTRTVTVNVIEIKHTVTFLDFDHETVIDTIEVGDEESLNELLPIPTNPNYIFNGWFIEDDSTRPFTSETVVSGDLTVVANWTPNIRLATFPEEFAVAINRTKPLIITGPDGMESYTISSGDNNIATVTQDGTNILVTGVAIGTTTINITGSRSTIVIQLPLEVTEVIMHTVTFHDYDNTFITSMQIEHETALTDNDLSLPTPAPRQNHILDGWFINNDNLTPFTTSTPVTGNLTVVARWKEELNIATITTNPDPFEFKVGKTGQVIVSPTGDGTVESHRFSSSDGNIATVDETTGEVVGVSLGTVIITITGNDTGQNRTVELTVNNLNNITFDPDNDDPIEIIKVADGSTIGENVPPNPTKDGYIFDGWYLYDEANEILTTTSLDPNEIINSDKTYKPKWVSNIKFTAIDKPTGTDYYTSIQEAIDHVAQNLADETEIRIIQDITNTSGQTIVVQNKKIRLNGGNHSVSCGQDTTNQLIINYGTLRIISGTFTCNKDTLAVLQNESKGKLYIDGGTISNTYNRGAIYNNGGAVVISGGTLTSTATIRPVVQNAKSGASILMTGGTVIQTTVSNVSTSGKDDGRGAIKVIAETSATILGGMVISNSPNSAGVYATGSNAVLTIGTQNNIYDATDPVIQSANYGVMSTITYSIFDGIIKGITAAVDDENMINTTDGIEPHSEKVNGTDGNYKTLYYHIPKYHIDFEANEGEVEDSFLEFYLDEEITEPDLPTPTKTGYTFDGWYTDEDLTEPFEDFTPTEEATVTYYAKWTPDT